MLTKDLGPLVLSLAVAGPASAEVKSATPTGFEIVTMATISAPADRVYAALGRSAAGGARRTPSRAVPATSAWNCTPAVAFASG